MSRNPLIVALDFESAGKARELVARLGDHISFYKVGLELYAAAGMDFVRELIAQGKEVFLDLKLYDIGETVKRAVAQVAASGVRFTTVHGSKPVMQAAIEGRGASRLQLLAVTVLTSFDQDDLADLGYPCSIPSWWRYASVRPLKPAWTASCARRWRWPRCARWPEPGPSW